MLNLQRFPILRNELRKCKQKGWNRKKENEGEGNCMREKKIERGGKKQGSFE